MNLKEKLRHLADLSSKDRATGRTTRLVDLVKQIGGIFITHNNEAAVNAQRKHPGLVARSMDTNLTGYTGPFVYDHHVVERMFYRAADKMDELEEKNAFLKRSMEVYIENVERELAKMRAVFEKEYDHTPPKVEKKYSY